MRLLLGIFLAGLATAGDVSFKIAGLRVTPAAWDKRANLTKLADFARQAATQGAQLVVTPEGFLEGYVGNKARTTDLARERYFAVGEPLDGPIMNSVRELARELRIFLLVGFAERSGDRMLNSAVIFSPEGSLVSRYSKTHTGNGEPFNTKGTEFTVVDTPLGCLGTLICMDRQMPETSRILALRGAQLILVPAWGTSGELNDIMMRTRAYENGVWVAFVHPKRCLIIDPRGRIVAQDHGEADQIVTAEIALRSDQNRGSPIRFRRPELYQELSRPPR